jgi:hypothetical protein
MADVRGHDALRTPSMMPAFTGTSRSRWKSMLDSVRSSIIAATEFARSTVDVCLASC